MKQSPLKQRIMILLVVLGLCAWPLYHSRAVSGKTGAGHSLGAPLPGLAAVLGPTLGTYPDAPVALGGTTTVTPNAAPTATTRLNVATNTNFKGTFAADPATGVVRVTNAHPAGTYTVTMKAFDSLGASTTQSFTLTVQTGVACAVTPPFVNAPDVSTGFGARFAAIGDFNGDGKQDLAVGNQTFVGSGTVSIRLGDGLGGFSGSTEVSVGPQPASVAPQPNSVVIGDFNGDGKQDFAAANQGIDTVSIRLGDGMGGFSGTTEISVGSRPSEIVLGDFNNDGKQDFATSNFGSANVSIRFGDGSGGFSGTTTINVGSGPSGIAIGDFNGDGNQDFAVSNTSGVVSIRLGNGTGGFTSATDVSVAGFPRSVAIGDFNNDGKQDLATAGDSSNLVSIRLGNGLGGFTGTTNVSVAGAPFYVAIGDFNGDGKQDFVTSNSGFNSTPTASIRLGDGLGGFSGNTNVSTGGGQWCVAIGDFNGDGQQDFAIPNLNTTVSIRLGGCDVPPTLTPTGVTLTAGQTRSATPIATANDDRDVLNTLQITISSDDGMTFNTSATSPSGVTVTLTDSNALATGTNPDAMGKVLAEVAAACNATNATFKLRVTDSGSLSYTATLTVTVNPNQLPTLSYPSNPGTSYGTGLTINPLTGPSDDLGVTSVVVQSITPSNPGGISVDSSGGVSVANTVPAGTYTVTIRANADCGNKDASFSLGIAKATPVITWNNPAAITYGTALSATQLNAIANVPGTYVYTPVSGTVLAVGMQMLRVDFTPTDTNNYNTAFKTVTITVTGGFNFTGFFSPVDNAPIANVVTAGQGIPVKFSLGGNQGLNIFAAGYPTSQAIACTTGAPVDDIEETVTAGASSLSYDAATGRYSYVWKTDKAWKGTCRKLVLKFTDGTTREALFTFK